MPVKQRFEKRKSDFVSYTLFAFNESELKRLLDACNNLSDYIMILLASRYGFRREDVVSIKINDINLKDATITYYEHKKDKSRTIPIEPDVVIELKRYINTIPKDRSNLLAITDGSSAWNHLQEICKVAGIPVPPGRKGRPFHSLRGTCVKMRQKQGWTTNEVAALIGDEPETVSKHYATTSPSELAEKMKGK
jgi:integrase